MPSDEEVTQRAGSLRSLTGLTEADFQALLPYCARAFGTYRHDRTIDGQPRMSRRYSTYETCPLPTTADKRLGILTYWKQNPLQEGQGQFFRLAQSNANMWTPLLHPVLNHALADQELLLARTVDDLAARLMTPPTEVPVPCARFFMMGPSELSSVRKTRRSSTRMTVGRRHATRAKTVS